MKSSKRDFLSEVSGATGPGIAGIGLGNQGTGLLFQQSKPEPMFGEDLFQSVTNRVMLEKDINLTEDNIIKGRLIKGSMANLHSSNPISHFQINEKGVANII